MGLLLRVVLHADFFELAAPKVAREATRRRMNVFCVTEAVREDGTTVYSYN